MKKYTRQLLLGCALAGLVACSDGNTATDRNGYGNTGNSTATTGTTTAVTVLQPLTVDETATLLFVREEEKLARDTYLTLYERWGLPIFQNIALRSEQTHMDSVKKLVDAAGLLDPVYNDAVGAFTDPDLAALYTQLTTRGLASLSEALSVGAYIEEYDINDLQEAIDEAMDGSNQLPVIQTYMNLLCGSRNHLRSFVSQIESSGTTYQPQVLPAQTLAVIVNSPMEQCGL